MDAFAQRCAQVTNEFSCQGVANTCWALAVLSAYDCPALPRLWARYADIMTQALAPSAEGEDAQVGGDTITRLDWAQLHEVATLAAAEAPGVLAPLPPSVAARAASTWASCASSGNNSKTHSYISLLLKTELKVGFTRNKVCSRTGRTVDIAIEPGEGLRFALMVDGPPLFTRNTWQQTGSARARDRALGAAGWAVVAVPHFAMETLQNSPRACADYLRKRLAEATQEQLARQGPLRG